MRRAITLCLAAQVGVSILARAQEVPAAPAPHGWSRSIVHYGKWATAATAVGLTILAAREHASAQDHWRQLIALCRDDNAGCQLRSDGRYVDDGAELLYQRTAYYDRRARSRLLGGQVALLASAALFLADLRHKGGNPPNIPFHGLELTAQPAGDAARLGVRLAF
jgi:hypothetical protein